MKINQPKVTVLMATWNGAQWLEEQVNSIFCQINCVVNIIVSDDHSTDSTHNILNEFSKRSALSVMGSSPFRFGNANRNFINLILHSNVDGADFVAFSDQDDVWDPDKLHRATTFLKSNKYDSYSSNVIAFWNDGSTKKIIKSYPQKKYDYLFESAGPGCTFVLEFNKFIELRAWVKLNRVILEKFLVHDWFIYAYARSKNWNWFIDPLPSMRYRQHGLNEVGANVGVAAAKARFLKFVTSDYLGNSILIGNLTAPDSKVLKSLKFFSLLDLIYLIAKAGEFRRRPLEVWVLRFMLICRWISVNIIGALSFKNRNI